MAYIRGAALSTGSISETPLRFLSSLLDWIYSNNNTNMDQKTYDALYNVIEYVKGNASEDMGAPEGESTLDYVRTVEGWMQEVEKEVE